MPRITMEVNHTLSQEEALQRVKSKIDQLKQAYQDQVDDLHDHWEDDTLWFGFRAAGMQVKGSATVADSCVALAAELPLAAMLFRGKIEKGIRAELHSLLG